VRRDCTVTEAAQPSRGGRVIVVRSIFSPLSLAVFLFVPVLALYVVSSATVFDVEFDSRKALSPSGLAYFGLALLLFAAGAKAGDDAIRFRRRRGLDRDTELEPTPAQRRSLTVLLEAALVVSVGAYALWFGLGIVRAGGVLELVEIWRSDPQRVKSGLLLTLPGITTLTQLAVAAIPLAIAFGLARRGSAIRVLVAIVLVLVVIRTLLFSERLALLELLLPVLFLFLAPRRVTVSRAAIYAGVFLATAMTLFAATELRRTYVYTNDFSVTTSATRFFGYYLTSVNNGMAVIDEYPARTPFYSTGEFLWQFPGVRDLRVEQFPYLDTVSLRYVDAFGIDPPSFWREAFLAQRLDLEFSVFTAPGYLAADFGWAGLIAVFAIGLVSGRLYRASETSPFHRALYAVWLVGLFEFMRILYFTNTRVFPAYLVFLAAAAVLRRPGLSARTAEVLREPTPGVRAQSP